MLKSGATIKAAVRAFDARAIEAVDGACESAGKKIESRGRKWRAAIAGIRVATNRHFDGALGVLGPTIRVASEGAEALTSPLIQASREASMARLSEWEQGWAGDRGKPWRERYPALWWAFTVLVSALLGFGLAVGKDHLGNSAPDSPAAKPVRAPTPST